MPAFLIPAIVGALISVCTSLVGRVILALGMGVVSYTGINLALDVFRSYFNDAMSGVGGDIAGLCGVLQLDACFSIFVAAGLAKLTIAGATSGTMKKLAMK